MKQRTIVARASFVFCLFATVFLFFALSSSAFANEIGSGTCGKYGDNLTWSVDDNGKLVILGTGDMEDYEYLVGGPSHPAPWDSYDVRSVVIGDQVSSIGDMAFYGVSYNLQDVLIPESIRTIGIGAFMDCQNITELTLPYGIRIIKSSAFMDMINLTEIVIPNSIEYLGDFSFAGCTSLENVILSNNLESIEEFTFSGCKKLGPIVSIPNGVETIGKSAFSVCENIQQVNIPDSVTDIGQLSFMHCHSLTTITIPKNLKTVGQEAFLECYNLTSAINLPEGCKRIEAGAFFICRKITDVTLPSTLEYIGNSAFAGPNLIVSDIVIPEGITDVTNAFMDCEKLGSITIPKSAITIDANAYNHCQKIIFKGDPPSNLEDTLADPFMPRTICFPCTNNKWKIIDKSVFYSYINWEPVHSMTYHPKTAASHDKAGNKEYWECSGCHKKFKDAIGSQEYADNEWIIPATGGDGDVPSGGGEGIPSEEADVDTVQQIVDQISALKEPFDAAKVRAAREAYNKLTDEQKKDPRFTDELLKKLSDAEAAVKTAQNQEAADKVTDLIKAIPDDFKNATSDQITGAVEAYNRLTPIQKKLIDASDLEKLQSALNYSAKVQKAVIKSVTMKKGKQAVIKWKNNSLANGYQIYYKAKGAKAKIISIKGQSKVRTSVKKLKAGKKYTIKIRTYVDVEKLGTGEVVKVYGQWSKVKKAMSKK